MTSSKIRPAAPAAPASGVVAAVPPQPDRIMNLQDVADYLRCAPEEAQQFVTANHLIGVEFPSGLRYLQSDLFTAFTAQLLVARAKYAEQQKADELQNFWVKWLNSMQASLTPSEQDGWVKFARFLVTRKIPPADFFRRGKEEQQNMQRLSGIDFRLRDDYGTAHMGLEASKSSGVVPALPRSTAGPITRTNQKPFGG